MVIAPTEQCGHGWIASDPSEPQQLRSYSEKSTSQNGDSESLYRHGLKMGFCNYYVAYAFVVCVQINNEELFLMLSRLKIHIILFLDRLRRGA